MFALQNKEFKLAELGNDAGIYGCAKMVIDQDQNDKMPAKCRHFIHVYRKAMKAGKEICMKILKKQSKES